jgi:pimeloyl-ACP methyl ester carboxylesterase
VWVATLAGFAGRPPSAGPLLARARAALAAHVARDGDDGAPVVVGHSLGGWLALALALDVPSRITEVVLVDAVPSFAHFQMNDASEERIAAEIEARERRLLMCKGGAASIFERAFATMIADEHDRAAVIREAAQSDLATLAHAMSELWRSDLRLQMGAVRAHVTSIVPIEAGLDPAQRVARIARYERQSIAIPAGRLETVEPSRHFAMLDRPASFFAILDRAVTRACGRSDVL